MLCCTYENENPEGTNEDKNNVRNKSEEDSILWVFSISERNLPYFSSVRTPQMKQSLMKNWISKINGSKRISSLNIPGTHQTMSLFGGPAITVAQCQTWTLQDQFLSGIRYIDIRIRRTRDRRLPIYHGRIFQEAYFEANVLSSTIEFLQNNPTEFIIMNVKDEFTPEEGADSLEQLMDEIIRRYESVFFLQKFNSILPRVEQIRGKIVIFPYYSWKLRGFSLKELANNYVLLHQDEFSIDPFTKMECIKQIDDLAKNHWYLRSLGKKLFINNINAVLWNKWPCSFAISLNEFVLKNKLFEGIIALDFPGEELIQQIVHSNSIVSYSSQKPVATMISSPKLQNICQSARNKKEL